MQAGSQLAETDEQNAGSVAAVKRSYAVMEHCRMREQHTEPDEAVVQPNTTKK